MKKLILAAVAALAAGAYTAPAMAADCDVKKGKKIFKRCKACHKLEEGKHGIGPSLFQIVNRPVASVADFENYSDAIKALGAEGAVWNEESMNGFFEKPKKYLPGTNMGFNGLKKGQQRADLICFLKEEAGETTE